MDLSDAVGSSWTIRRSGTAVELLLSREEILAGEFGQSESAGFTMDVTELDAEAAIPVEIVKRAQLLIVEVRQDHPASLRRLATLREENPSLAIVAAVRDTSVSSMRVLLRAGISDVLPLPFTQHELASVLGQLRAELDRSSQSTAPAGKAVSVIKSVGGVGATALLTQMASLYAEREAARGRQACLFDLDLQGGNAATYLGVTPSMTMSELFEAGSRVDGAVMRSVAVAHPLGLQIFAAPNEMMPLEAVETDQICDIVHLATMEYGTVFIDLPSDWTNWSLSLVARSQVVFLVVELTIASLRQAQRQLALLNSLGVDPASIQIVVNRVEKRMFKQIDLRDAADTLGRPIAFSVTSDFPLMNTALNRGTMLRDIQRKNAIDRDLAKMLDGIDMLLDQGLNPMWQIKKAGVTSLPALRSEANDAEASAARGVERHTDLKVELHQRLLDLINLAALDSMSREQIQAEIGELVHEQLSLQNHALNLTERRQLVSDILDELLGLGPIEPLLKDESITDILVNGHGSVFVERHGKLEASPVRFKDERHLLRIIQKIVSAVGRRVDESSPYVDARLADGSRVNAIIPPLAVDGSLLSIRKFARVPIDMARLTEYGSVPAEIAEVLRAIVAARRNILISGGTGSGKTTLLNAMSAFIDESERIVTIEDSAELQLQQSHVARLETRPANIEGHGEVSQRELVKNALRMRPDRIIVGEVRAGEAFDMLQAMNTGHDGSMTTVHANTARDALSRVEQMIGMSGVDIAPRSARAQIASALNVIIQVGRLADGRRRLMSLSEVTGMEGEIITMQDIFRFKMSGRDEHGGVLGQFEATGIRPKFMQELDDRGIRLPVDLFRPDQALG